MEKCEKCGATLNDNAEFCIKCGTPRILASTNYRRTSMSKVYIVIAWLIIIASIIGGIVLGDTFKINELTYKSSIAEYNEYEEIFNTALMFYTWIGGFILSMFIMGIGSICHRLDLLIDKEK